MKQFLAVAIVVGATTASPSVAQQPLDADCSAAATQATGFTPGTSSTQPGGRVAGAAKGAAAGAAVGAVQGNQHENAPEGMKNAHQENQAKTGAAAGMVASGSRNRQARREDRKAEDDWRKAYDTCLANKPK